MDSLEEVRRRRDLIAHLDPFLRAVRSMAEIAYHHVQASVPALDAYSRELERMLPLADSAKRVHSTATRHPEETAPIGVIVVSSERGFCGRFPEIAVQHGIEVAQQIRDQGGDPRLICLGTRGKKLLETGGHEVAHFRPLSTLGITQYSEVEAFAVDLLDMCEAESLWQLVACSNEPTGRFTFRPVDRVIWPPDVFSPGMTGSPATNPGSRVIPDSDQDRLTTHLATEHLLLGLYRIILHSAMAEQLARVSAMTSASGNAEELVAGLSQEFLTRSRQEETTALMEIVAGYEVTR